MDSTLTRLLAVTDEPTARAIGKASFDAFVDRLMAQMQQHAGRPLDVEPAQTEETPLCAHSASDYRA